jgi:hypothetical protein
MKRFTPGVVDSVQDNKLSVRFENGSGHSLLFQCDQKDYVSYLKVGPAKRPDLDKERKLFSIVGDNWKLLHGRRYFGNVKYENQDYVMRFRLHHRPKFVGELPYLPSLVVNRDRNLSLHIMRRRIRGKRLR